MLLGDMLGLVSMSRLRACDKGEWRPFRNERETVFQGMDLLTRKSHRKVVNQSLLTCSEVQKEKNRFERGFLTIGW